MESSEFTRGLASANKRVLNVYLSVYTKVAMTSHHTRALTQQLQRPLPYNSRTRFPSPDYNNWEVADALKCCSTWALQARLSVYRDV